VRTKLMLGTPFVQVVPVRARVWKPEFFPPTGTPIPVARPPRAPHLSGADVTHASIFRSMPRTPAPILDALHLRAWALSALSSSAPATPPPDASLDGWSLFLRGEQCALALSARGAAGREGPGAQAVHAFAVAESRNVLAARGQLRRMEALARAQGLRILVLKGGVPLLHGAGGPRLLDVDVLCSPADAAAVAAALDRAGYHGTGSAGAHRLAVRVAENDIAMEIHTAVPGVRGPVWERARPAGPDSALLVLHPADHLLHLLLHSVVQHADRRGRVRELLVIADAIGRCAPEDLAAVREAAAREPEAALLANQLSMAQALIDGRGAPEDAFRLTAAGTYVMAATFPRWGIRGSLLEFAWLAGIAAVARRTGTPSGLGAHTLDLPSAWPPLALLRRVAPPAERAARLLFRRGREWILLPVGLFIAADAERAVRELPHAG